MTDICIINKLYKNNKTSIHTIILMVGSIEKEQLHIIQKLILMK